MDHFDFEKKTLKHNVYYVMALLIDVLQAKVHVELVFDPIAKQAAVVLDFFQCEQFVVDYYGEKEEDPYLASFLGVQNIHQDTGTNYVITTDVAEVAFFTDREPAVIWNDKTALTLDYKPEKLRVDDEEQTVHE